MELEIGKIYDVVIGKCELATLKILKKNKSSYSVGLKSDKKTMWFNEKGFFFKERLYDAFARNYRNDNIPVDIINEREKQEFVIRRNISICGKNFNYYVEQIKDIEKQILELENKKIELENKKKEYVDNKFEYAEKIKRYNKKLEDFLNGTVE